jgi:hypothetical protein
MATAKSIASADSPLALRKASGPPAVRHDIRVTLCPIGVLKIRLSGPAMGSNLAAASALA